MLQSCEIKFHLAIPEDASLLQPMVQSAYRAEDIRQGWTGDVDLASGFTIDESEILTKITSPDSAVLIATDEDDALVACCEVVKRGTELAYFGMLAVDQRLQRGGLGRQVLAYAEEYCRREWGSRKMEMMVLWTRQELIEWYVRCGYAKTGATRPFPYDKKKERPNGAILRADLYFEVLEKSLSADLGQYVAA